MVNNRDHVALIWPLIFEKGVTDEVHHHEIKVVKNMVNNRDHVTFILLLIVKKGVTDEVHHHEIKVVPGNMSYESVLEMAGPTIATFCKDYTTIYGTAVRLTKRG